jgi:hypothetical protein
VKHKKTITNSKGYKPEDLFGEGDSVHDLAQKFFRAAKFPPSSSTPSFSKALKKMIQLYDGRSAIHSDENAAKLQDFFRRLASSDPRMIFEKDTALWKKEGLLCRPDTFCWAIAYEYFGAPWKRNQQMFLDLQGQPFVASSNINLSHSQDDSTVDDPLTKRKLIDTSLESKVSTGVRQKQDSQNTELNLVPSNGSDFPLQSNRISLSPGLSYSHVTATTPPNIGKNNVTDMSQSGQIDMDSSVFGSSKTAEPSKPAATLQPTTTLSSAHKWDKHAPTAHSTERSDAPPTVKKVGWSKAPDLYIDRALKVDVQQQTTSQHGKRYVTFVKFKSGKIYSSVLADQEIEFHTYLTGVLKELWKIDSSLVLLPWQDYATNSPLTSKMKLAQSKQGMSVYCSQIYLQPNTCAWPRLRIGHNLPISDILSADLDTILRSNDERLTRENIQHQHTSNVGFLLGSTPGCFNAANLEAALMQHTAMPTRELEIRMEYIRREKGGKIDRKTSSQAIQIYCHIAQAAAVRLAMLKIYGGGNTTGYPLGRKAIFVPTIFDQRFPVTSNHRINYHKAADKQKEFVLKLKTYEFEGVLGLDYRLKGAKISLRQAIMSVVQRNTRLFLAVEESYGTGIKMVARESDDRIASDFVEAMPLILAASHGLEIWTWFSFEARNRLEGYDWSPEHGLTSKMSEEYDMAMAEFLMDEDLNGDDVIDVTNTSPRSKFEFDFREVTSADKNHLFDTKSIGTFRTGVQDISNIEHIDEEEDEDTDSTNDLAQILSKLSSNQHLKEALLSQLSQTSKPASLMKNLQVNNTTEMELDAGKSSRSMDNSKDSADPMSMLINPPEDTGIGTGSPLGGQG